MANRVVEPSSQRHYIEPFDQRVFQYDTEKSDVFLSRVANSVYRIFGDDIVMSGLELTSASYSSDSVTLAVEAGNALQDNTLLSTEEAVPLQLDGVSGLDPSGKIVVFCNYGYLQTFEQNKHSYNINYIDSTGNPLYDFVAARDRLVLGIYEFSKDGADNVIGFTPSVSEYLTINGTNYWVRGYSDKNRVLTRYLIHQLFELAGASSVILDPEQGIILKGDVESPGAAKYYGTNNIGSKGFFDVSSLSIDNESSLAQFLTDFNQIFRDGNMHMIDLGLDSNAYFSNVPFYNNNIGPDNWTIIEGSSWNNRFYTLQASRDNMILDASGKPWVIGFRPTKMRVSWTEGSTQRKVWIESATGTILSAGQTLHHNSGEEIDIIGVDEDIDKIYVASHAPLAQVTKIEFFSEPVACACNCNYGCTCDCNYGCTCDCNYACTCDCNYSI